MQLAIDGIWERATRAAVTGLDVDDAVARLAAPLRPRGEYAIEVFARDDLGHITFCGLRFEDATRTEAEGLLRELWTVARHGARLGAIVDWLTGRTGQGLFDTPCSAVEVGVVDAWRSCGAVCVFPAERFGSPPESSDTLITAAKRIGAPVGAVIAAEFASATARTHWVAVEIARVGVGDVVMPQPPIHSAAAFLAELRGNGAS